MTADEEVERLRRVAYGPGATAEDRASAVAALRTLADQESELVGTLAPPEAGEVEPAADNELDDEPERPPGIRPLWLIPIVVASIAMGAIGALAVSSQFEAPPSALSSQSHAPAESTPPSGVVDGPGNLKAAEQRFDGGATPTDAFPDAAFLESLDIDQYDVRFMASEGNDWSVWVAKDRHGQLCLLVRNPPDGGAAASCVPADEFVRNGISIGLNDHTSYWDGTTVSTDRAPVG